MSAAETHEEMHGRFNNKDYDGMTERMTEDVIFTDHATGQQAKGRDEAKQYLQAWHGGFSDGQASNGRYLDGGDFSVAFFDAVGTHDGTFGDVPATDRSISVPFCEVTMYTGEGQVRESHLYYDAASIMGQLGLLGDSEG